MFEIVKKTFRWGNQTVTIETGEIARQSTGAALVTVEGTVVLATVVVAPDPKPGQDFFPLTVDYVEKFYAAGRIPGGFLKREGRPTEREILTSRVIDRSVRPLFPSGFYNEVQVMVQVLSCDPSVESDIPALIAASSALALSGIPFDGPIGAAKVGYHNGEYLLNPAGPTLAQSALDLVVAGTDVAILMVESEARELPETIMLGAIQFGHEAMQPVIAAIDEIVAQAGKPDMAWKPPVEDKVLSATVATLAQAGFEQAYATADKQQRTAQIRETEHATLASLSKQAEAEGKPAPKQNEIRDMLFGLRARLMRQRILSGEPRIDGRNTRTVRPIAIRGGGLPRAHGSCLFTRGETQAWVSATLGTSRDEQIVDAISAEYRDRFIVHYNMPPFATGEVGRTGSPKRREIGHGNLMKRALRPLLPTAEDFAYSIRLVSEITESNGSSSMASVCGGCLALMDAGVPIRSHVAGIAMGLIKEGNRFAVLTDILGDEDYLGDMDFKIAGTATGITALQMDIKIQGITKEIMQVALAQGYEARMHVLARMEQAVSGARQELSLFAPRMYTMRINPDRIRDVIGKGGATIRQITEMTSTQIDIQDDGSVTIAAVDAEDGRRAQKMIEDLTEEVEVGRTYDGTVKKILTFGAIVQILAGREGLLHISEISNERDIQISDHLQQGQTIRVKVIDSDGEKGRFRLSLKAALAETAA